MGFDLVIVKELDNANNLSDQEKKGTLIEKINCDWYY